MTLIKYREDAEGMNFVIPNLRCEFKFVETCVFLTLIEIVTMPRPREALRGLELKIGLGVWTFVVWHLDWLTYWVVDDICDFLALPFWLLFQRTTRSTYTVADFWFNSSHILFYLFLWFEYDSQILMFHHRCFTLFSIQRLPIISPNATRQEVTNLFSSKPCEDVYLSHSNLGKRSLCVHRIVYNTITGIYRNWL